MATYVSVLDFTCAKIRIQRLTDEQEAEYLANECDGDFLMVSLGYKLSNISYMITDGYPHIETL